MREDIVMMLLNEFNGQCYISDRQVKHRMRLKTIAQYIDDYPEEVEEVIDRYNNDNGCLLSFIACENTDITCGSKECIKSTIEAGLYNLNNYCPTMKVKKY